MLYFSRLKTTAILLVCLAGLLFALPNFLPANVLKSWPSWLPGKQVVLGLDLQGGVYLLYEIDTESYRVQRLKALQADIRQTLRNDPRIGYTGLGELNGVVSVKLRDLAQKDDAAKRLKKLENPLTSALLGNSGVTEFNMTQEDDGTFRFTFNPDGLNKKLEGVADQSIEVIRRRVDAIGTTEPSIQRNGTNRILVEAPGEKDPQRLKDIIGKTAQLTFQLVDVNANPQQALQSAPPIGDIVLKGAKGEGNVYVVEETPLMTGEDLVDSSTGFDPQTNEPLVNFRLSTAGAAKFAQVTAQNIGKPFAIVLDNEVISAPVIRSAIPGGQGQISGSFTVQSANDLAVLLRAGALPAKLSVVQERTVGPSLGADSISAGQTATVVGVTGVALYMLANYGLLGLFANIAVVINVIFTLAVLTGLGATLTLPGIAGIVLGVGMAVDANVLIYERIREEQMIGMSAIAAIDQGFKRAIATITDTNLTHVIAASVLYMYGTGPVKGFALTLIIGTITSFFTAVTVTRLIIAIWYRQARPTRVPL